jgi:hypothetical protein
MIQMQDSKGTQSQVAGFDVIDLLSFSIFILYCSYGLAHACKAFSVANRIFKEFKTHKNHNLYNLIFEDTEFEIQSLMEDLSASRFSAPGMFIISFILLSLLFMPP